MTCKRDVCNGKRNMLCNSWRPARRTRAPAASHPTRPPVELPATCDAKRRLAVTVSAVEDDSSKRSCATRQHGAWWAAELLSTGVLQRVPRKCGDGARRANHLSRRLGGLG